MRLLEVMTRAARTADGVDSSGAERGGAMVVGPGMGRLDDAQELARELAAARRGAAGARRRRPQRPRRAARGPRRPARAPTVLTPHEGELGRLLGVDSARGRRARLHHAREAARRAGAIVVLKGDDTLVAEPDGRVAVNPGATAALATAGTGDVLSGVLGALLAKGMEPFTAACAAVLLHARAGRLRRRAHRRRGRASPPTSSRRCPARREGA